MKNTRLLKTAKFGYMAMSAAFCALGILLMIFPGISLSVLCWILGIGMLLYGAIKIIGYFSKDLYRLAFQFDLAFGILLCAIGIFLLFKPQSVISLLYFMIGILIFSDGLFKIQMSVDSKKFGISGWWGILLLALVTCATGAVLIVNPFESARFIMMLLGLSLLIEGVLNLFVSIITIKIIRQKSPHLLDADCEFSDDTE